MVPADSARLNHKVMEPKRKRVLIAPGLDPKLGDLPSQVEVGVWRTEPTDVEKSVDELWVGVKGQSNQAISGSLRKLFRQCLLLELRG